MFDYLSSIRVVNQILARVAKSVFTFTDTKPKLESKKKINQLRSKKIIWKSFVVDKCKRRYSLTLDDKKTNPMINTTPTTFKSNIKQ